LVSDAAYQDADGAAEAGLVEVRQFFAEGDGHVRGLFAPAFADREQQAQQPLLHLRAETADHPQIDQCEEAVVGDKHVARVRIGVEHAIDHDLFQIGAHQRIGEHFAIELDGDDRADFRDLGSADVIHRQHASRRVAFDRLWNRHQLELLQVLAEQSQVIGFAHIIELGENRGAKLFDHPGQVITLARFTMRCHELRDLVQRLEIGSDLVGDARPLHFDGHDAAVAQRGAVDLAQGCGGDRTLFEYRERLRQAHAELFLDNALDIGKRHRLDVVLEACQGFEVRRRQQVDTSRQQLAELHERGPERLEVACQRGCRFGVGVG
jgi:hypothetical protein